MRLDPDISRTRRAVVDLVGVAVFALAAGALVLVARCALGGW